MSFNKINFIQLGNGKKLLTLTLVTTILLSACNFNPPNDQKLEAWIQRALEIHPQKTINNLRLPSNTKVGDFTYSVESNCKQNSGAAHLYHCSFTVHIKPNEGISFSVYGSEMLNCMGKDSCGTYYNDIPYLSRVDDLKRRLENAKGR